MAKLDVGRENDINLLLDDIESKYEIKILHAVESGSRAWGFPSEDSDYDVRFIYRHPADWYISAFERDDYIDLGMMGELDAGGWDIAKCMRLLRKGNAVVHEWLSSPVVYRSLKSDHEKLMVLSKEVFNPAAAFYHYISQVKKRLSEEKTRTNAKAFLYSYRSLLCAKWIVDYCTVPPVTFDTLVQKYLTAEERICLADVLKVKAEGVESDSFLVPAILWDDCTRGYETLGACTVPARKSSREIYDTCFKSLLGIMI